MIASYPDYGEWGYGGSYLAEYYLDFSYNYPSLILIKGKYKFEFNPANDAVYQWVEVFMADDPTGELTVAERSTVMYNGSCPVTGAESDPYPSDCSMSSQNGHTAIYPAPSIALSDGYSNLDSNQTTQTGILAGSAGGSGGMFSVNLTGLVGEQFSLTWGDPNFQVWGWDNGQWTQVISGETLDTDQWALGFQLVAASNPTGDSNTIVSVTEIYPSGITSANGAKFYAKPLTISVPADDASGALYRKVALNGRPLPDARPQQAEEGDQQPEETFVDAMTLGLRHSTTDAYMPVPGSELSLAARRNAESEVWNYQSGLRPWERVDLPFGVGWNTNLSANVKLVSQPNDLTYATVTDENGATYRFAAWNDSGWQMHFFPFPTSRHEQQTYLSSLISNSDGTYTFKRKFGSTLIYAPVQNLTASIPLDRITGGDGNTMTIEYARLASVMDRLGQVVNYNYASNNTLVPETIIAVGRPDLSLYIEQNQAGQITDIWDAKWNHTTYTYQSYSCVDGKSLSVLSAVQASDGKQTTYTYNSVLEADQTPLLPDSLSVHFQYTHCDIASITDPNGQTYAFTYLLDYMHRFNYQNNVSIGGSSGYYPSTGNPREVSSVSLPDGTSAHFQDNSIIQIAGTGSSASLTSGPNGSIRQTVITDAANNSRTYTWGTPVVCDVNTIQSLIAFPWLGPSFNDPQIVYYTSLAIDYGNSIVENFTFDLTAGLAIASATDPDRHTTYYQHTDAWTPSADYSAVLPPSLGINGYFDDPNVQTDALGGTKTFTYNANRLMSSVVDEAGRKTQYVFDSTGQLRVEEDIYPTATSSTPIQTTTYAYGNSSFPGFMTLKTVKDLSNGGADLVTQYVPDADGRVSQQIVNPGGLNLTTTYTYDADGNKLTATDPNGHTTAFGYDKRNRLVLVTYPDATTKSYAYDNRGNKISETDENGHVTAYGYDTLNRLTTQTRHMNGAGPDLVTTYAYNAANSKISVTDPKGYATTYDYDTLQRLIQTTDPYTNHTTYAYGANAGSTLFDSSSYKPTQVTDPRGYVTTVAYDALHRPTSKGVQYQLTPSVLTSTTQTVYDAVGNALSVTDPVGNVTQTAYDALNRPVLVTYADGNQLATAYTSTGLKATVTEIDTADAISRPTDTQYDRAGRPTYVLQPTVDNGSGTQARPTTQTVYDPAGNAIATLNPLNQEWDTAYDVRNRKIAEQAPAVANGPGGALVHPVTTTGYDGVGNVVSKTDPRGNLSGASGYTTTIAYDPANRPVATTAPAVPVLGGGTGIPITHTEYDPNGNVACVRDPNGHTVRNTYDKLNRLTASEDGAGDTVTTAYDSVGNKVSVQDGDGSSHTTAFTYDGLNRLRTQIDALGGTTTFTYDGLNKTGRTDALGQQTTYAYDNRNRLAAVTYASSDAANSPRAYGYDNFGNLLSVTESAQTAANAAYTYDALHRVLTEANGGATHTYAYDLAGNRLQVTHGGPNTVLTSTYDALNRLATLTASGWTTTYAYDLNGNTVAKTNEILETDTYDALNRLQTRSDHNGGGTYFQNLAETYDLAGNLRQSVETYPSTSANNRTVANTYDGANRLTDEVITGGGARTTHYTYDAANNRTGMTVGGVATSYTVNALNQLTAVSGGLTASYGYDANGNRTGATQGGASDIYGYDFENRLISLTKNTSGGTGTYSYVYDYRTRRIQRTENGTATNLSFSGGTSAIEFTTNAASPTAEHIRGSDLGGGIGGILFTLHGGANLAFNFYDGRGDVVGQVNAAGSMAYNASYEAFGTRTVEGGSTVDRQKANTKDEDPTGLLNEGFRYRDLATGTFITRDPAGFVDGPNVYAYVKQNPWTHFDPEGLNDETIGQVYTVINHDSKELYVGQVNGLKVMEKGGTPERHEDSNHPAKDLLEKEGTMRTYDDVVVEDNWKQVAKDNGISEISARSNSVKSVERTELEAAIAKYPDYKIINKIGDDGNLGQGIISEEKAETYRHLFNPRNAGNVREEINMGGEWTGKPNLRGGKGLSGAGSAGLIIGLGYMAVNEMSGGNQAQADTVKAALQDYQRSPNQMTAAYLGLQVGPAFNASSEVTATLQTSLMDKTR